MKVIIKTKIAFLFFFLLTNSNSAQVAIGSICPDVSISKIVNYSSETTKLSDFRGKALILDFWATWCRPCVRSFPKLDSLQKKFSNDLQILPVTTESEGKVKLLLDKIEKVNGIRMPSVVNDAALSSLFKHNVFPHYVWIDADGIVKAVTDADNLTADNIQRLVRKESLNLVVKKDELNRVSEESRNMAGVLVREGLNFDDSNFVAYRVLTRHDSRYAAQLSVRKNRIIVTNASVRSLYELAFGEGFKFILGSHAKVLSRDSLKYSAPSSLLTQDEHKAWNKGNTYCYELVVPLADSAKKFKIMQQDLGFYFPLNAVIERQGRETLVLTTYGDNALFKTKGGTARESQSPIHIAYQNIPIAKLVNYLKVNYQEKNLDVINKTGYKGNIDIEINADLKNPDAIRKELRKIGIDLKVERVMTNILILRDK